MGASRGQTHIQGGPVLTDGAFFMPMARNPGEPVWRKIPETKMNIAKIEAARDTLRQLETRTYETGEKRRQAVMDARPILNGLFSNTPNGVMGLNTRTLTHPEATYLVIDLAHGNYGCVRDGRVRFTRVGFQQLAGMTKAVDLTTGEVLGEMNIIATTPYRLWQHDYCYSNNPLREAAYVGLTFGSPSPQDSLPRTTWVLPLTGPALQHPAFQRQAEFALDVLANKSMALNILLKLDREHDAIAKDAAAQQAIVVGIVAAVAQEFAPAEWDADLVKQIRSMDWTFDYADRPESRFYDQRTLIQRRLCALPLEVAVGFLSLAEREWQYPLRLLQNHPERVALAA